MLPRMTLAISARGLRRDYGSLVAVEKVDLDVAPGTITALVGPNGAGKTTLLRMLAGLLEPSGGSLSIMGIDTSSAPRELHARVGFLPDHFGIYEDLTPRQFLRYFARAYRLPPESVESRIVKVLFEVGLMDKADQPTEGLSRGMKQRLGVARTILHEPPVLLLDEPASGLDPGSRHDLQETLKRYAASGMTVIVSSHILAELEEYCTYVAVLDRGILLHYGPAAGGAPSRARRFRLRVAGGADPALLAGRAGVSNAAARDGELVFDLEGGDENAAALLRALVESGTAVVGFGEEREGMQDRYLAMIGRRE
jgi:ABC-2 type transport system ATP-binding protein